MTAFVLDASITLSWYFADEASEAADRLLERLDTETAAVPALWYWEVTNAIAIAERRNRTVRSRSSEFIAQLETLDIRADEDSPRMALNRVLDVARSEALSGYDAAYLELAMRLGVPLASKDSVLCAAAERCGLTVLRGA